jgi:hypothetical protein
MNGEFISLSDNFYVTIYMMNLYKDEALKSKRVEHCFLNQSGGRGHAYCMNL